MPAALTVTWYVPGSAPSMRHAPSGPGRRRALLPGGVAHHDRRAREGPLAAERHDAARQDARRRREAVDEANAARRPACRPRVAGSKLELLRRRDRRLVEAVARRRLSTTASVTAPRRVDGQRERHVGGEPGSPRRAPASGRPRPRSSSRRERDGRLARGPQRGRPRRRLRPALAGANAEHAATRRRSQGSQGAAAVASRGTPALAEPRPRLNRRERASGGPRREPSARAILSLPPWPSPDSRRSRPPWPP